MRSFIFIVILMSLPALSFAGPRLVYSTMVADSTALPSVVNSSSHASDVDPEGNVYFAVRTNFPNIADSDSTQGYRIYRVNPTGTIVTVMADIYGHYWCDQLIWRNSGIYIRLNDTLYKLDCDGNIEYRIIVIGPICVDQAGFIYVANSTTDDDIPTTPDAFETKLDDRDICIMKYDPEGTLLYSSFLGGPGDDIVRNFTIDEEGRWYLNCDVSSNFPYPIERGSELFYDSELLCIAPSFDTLSAYYINSSWGTMTCYDNALYLLQFSVGIRKYTTTGELLWYLALNESVPEITYSNQKFAEKPQAWFQPITFNIDDHGRMYIAQLMYSDRSFTITHDAIDDENIGAYDIGIWQVSPDGDLLYGTYFGGIGAEVIHANSVSFSNGSLYVTGYTTSWDFTLTPGAFIDTRSPYHTWGAFAFALDFNEITEVADDLVVTPDTFVLDPPHPNPFNPKTSISFTLPDAGQVRLAIYDISGRKVRELAGGQYLAGKHDVVWDGHDENGDTVSSGVYFCRLVAGKSVAVRKVTLVR